MIYQIECDNGHRYTQETEPVNDLPWHRPYQCGACGSKDIRVWAMVYDALSLVVTRSRQGATLPILLSFVSIPVILVTG